MCSCSGTVMVFMVLGHKTATAEVGEDAGRTTAWQKLQHAFVHMDLIVLL
jgi:hypothetical protein